MDITSEKALTFFKSLSTEDFLNIGMNQVVYIKKIKNSSDSNKSYSLYAANGSKISVMNSYDKAIAAAKVNDLHPVTVH